MKLPIFHFHQRGKNKTACGVRRATVAGTNFPTLTTCKRCKRTWRVKSGKIG